jgi:hypothetical protein
MVQCPICDNIAELKSDNLGEYYFCAHCIEDFCTDEQIVELINKPQEIKRHGAT